jgi:hypothetical protein
MAGELILIVEDNEKNRKLECDTPPALRPPGPRTRERRRPIEDQPRPWT